MKKNKATNEEIEFYTKEYVVSEDELNNSVDMTPHQIVTNYRPNTNAWTSFILGVIGSLGWLVPIIGLPVTIVGTVLGAVGMKNKRSKGIAISGFVISLTFLICSIGKGVVDIIFYFKNLKND